MKQLHLIYVPGLGDDRITNQAKLVNTWSKYGVSLEICQLLWSNGEWQPKLDKLLKVIDSAVAEDKDVALVAASAGASAATIAFAARQETLVGMVLIAGKVNHPERVGRGYKTKNPAFWTAVNQVQTALDSLSEVSRSHILSRRGVLDEVVVPSDNKIPGAVNQIVPSSGHVITIGSQLLFGAPSFIKFLRKLQKP